MDFEPSAAGKQLRETAQRLVAERIDPLLAREPERPLAKETVKELFRWLEPLGYLGARVPERLGGAELSYVDYGLLMEALPPVVAIAALAQETTATRIALSGDSEQLERFLMPVLHGELVAGSATSEPGAGSNPRAIATTARRDEDRWLVTGEKIWVTSGSICDLLMTVVTMAGGDGGRVAGRLVVDARESPFEAREIETIGLKQGHLSEVFFDSTPVPVANELGEKGDFHRFLTFTWLANRPIYGLFGAHIAQRALDAAVAYAREREQFGKPIGSFQLVQEMVVEIATLVDASRLLAYRALALLDKGEWAHKESSMAKLYGTEAAVRATSLAIQVHGSYGLTTEYGIEKLFRDARMLSMPEGTTQIQQLIMGRELLGIRAY